MHSNQGQAGDIVAMNLTLHRLMAATGVVLILIGVVAVRLSAIGFDFWNAPKLQAELRTEESLDHLLDSKSELVARRTAAKDAIVQDLADGRLDLVQAANQFSGLYESPSDFLAVLRAHYPGLSDEECIYRNTIEYASTRLEDRPDGPEILARLNRQFNHLRLTHDRPGA